MNKILEVAAFGAIGGDINFHAGIRQGFAELRADLKGAAGNDRAVQVDENSFDTQGLQAGKIDFADSISNKIQSLAVRIKKSAVNLFSNKK